MNKKSDKSRERMPATAVFSTAIQKAIRFSTKTHEVYQKQKRKGKDIPYITHPLTVGLILARAGASEEVIIAGILHDTIEDSVEPKKVHRDMIAERFGEKVMALVLSVTETDKSLSWEERKQKALEHIEIFTHDSVLVKSADVIANWSELLDDYIYDGDATFKRFNSSKERLLQNVSHVIGALLERWPKSPLAEDLLLLDNRLENIIE
jgi:(p)ppGpp synthase/HD superfamily hydrolase